MQQLYLYLDLGLFSTVQYTGLSWYCFFSSIRVLGMLSPINSFEDFLFQTNLHQSAIKVLYISTPQNSNIYQNTIHIFKFISPVNCVGAWAVIKLWCTPYNISEEEYAKVPINCSGQRNYLPFSWIFREWKQISTRIVCTRLSARIGFY